MSIKHQIALSNSGLKAMLKLLPLYFVGVALLAFAANSQASNSVFTELEVKKMEVGIISCDTSRLATPFVEIYSTIQNNLEWSHEGREWLFDFAASLEVDSSVTADDFLAVQQCKFSNSDWELEQARSHLQNTIFEEYKQHLNI